MPWAGRVGHRLRRSHRRSQRRIEEQLRVEVLPPSLDDEHEAVYQRYRTVARGERSSTLADLLFGDRAARTDIFDTLEVRFTTPDGRLAGFSWFDVGATSVQSLVGVYDPDFAHLGLGFGSMLYEIQWAQERNFHWFYPGYVLPGDAAMDYKLRVGDVEYLDPTGAWQPWSAFDPAAIPTAELTRRLEAVAVRLAERGVGSDLQVYPMFEAPAWHANLSNCVGDPLVLLVPSGSPRSVIAISWDLDRGAYRVRRCMQAAAISRSATDDLETLMESMQAARRSRCWSCCSSR